MEFSVRAVFVGVLAEIGLAQRSLEGGSGDDVVVNEFAPLAERNEIWCAYARILRSAGDVQEDVFELHVVGEEHLLDGVPVLGFPDHNAQLPVLQILFQHLAQMVVCVFHETREHARLLFILVPLRQILSYLPREVRPFPRRLDRGSTLGLDR